MVSVFMGTGYLVDKGKIYSLKQNVFNLTFQLAHRTLTHENAWIFEI